MARGKPLFPQHIRAEFGGSRGFQVAHRRALKLARYWINQARRGCVYSPDTADVQAADAAIERALEKCAPKNWKAQRT